MSDVAGLKKDLSRRMEGAVEVLHKEFTGLRTGRASVSLLEPVMVEAYGVPTPLNQVASVSVPESRMLSGFGTSRWSRPSKKPSVIRALA